eukprot:9503918-Pyramimonas_sp.AAC.2
MPQLAQDASGSAAQRRRAAGLALPALAGRFRTARAELRKAKLGGPAAAAVAKRAMCSFSGSGTWSMIPARTKPLPASSWKLSSTRAPNK